MEQQIELYLSQKNKKKPYMHNAQKQKISACVRACASAAEQIDIQWNNLQLHNLEAYNSYIYIYSAFFCQYT